MLRLRHLLRCPSAELAESERGPPCGGRSGPGGDPDTHRNLIDRKHLLSSCLRKCFYAVVKRLHSSIGNRLRQPDAASLARVWVLRGTGAYSGQLHDLVENCQNLGKASIGDAFHRMWRAAAQPPVEGFGLVAENVTG